MAMSGLALQLALVAVLILLNALFAASEMALLSLGEARVARLSGRGRAGRALEHLTRDPNRFLATIQVGITAAGFLASATAAVSLAEPLTGPLAFLGGAARPASIVVVTVILTFLTLVLGELAPKRIALQRTERLALLSARPLSAMFALFRPVVWLLGKSTDLVVRLFGVDPHKSRQEVTEDDLRDLVSSAQTLSPDQRTLLEGALEVAERSLRQVLRPRREVVTIPASMDAEEALDLLSAHGHSRAPVVEAGLDHTVGVIHLHDLVRHSGTAGELAHAALALPETLGVLSALREMRASREQLALVVDEHGGVEGIVTLEDLLEEIVGEIYDETDRDLAAVVTRADGSMDLVGGFPVHDLVDLGIELPAGEYATVAGLVMERLGRVPTLGDKVTLEGWDIEVTELDGRAVTRLQLRRNETSVEPASDTEPGPGGGGGDDRTEAENEPRPNR